MDYLNERRVIPSSFKEPTEEKELQRRKSTQREIKPLPKVLNEQKKRKRKSKYSSKEEGFGTDFSFTITISAGVLVLQEASGNVGGKYRGEGLRSQTKGSG